MRDTGTSVAERGVDELAQQQSTPPAPYAAGSWGPSGVFALTERNGHSWYE